MGWFKINSGVTFKDGKAGIALVVKDYRGSIIWLALKIIDYVSAHHFAELNAIL